MRGEDVLQGSQFFRERISRAQQYAKDLSHNGHASSDEPDDDQTREIAAHKHVFQRP